jgi:D-alanine-D-alanine ligase-like ATP-grasp enzyme
LAQSGPQNQNQPPNHSGQKTKNGYTLPKTVGIIYSEVKRQYFPTKNQYLTEKDALRDAKIIASYLEKLNIKVHLYPGNAKLPQKLKANKPEMVLNLVGSVKGNEYLASTIPALLELLEIPYTGAGILGESLSYNKFLIKKLLQQNGVPVPYYQLFNTPTDPLDPTLRFPLISKLNEIHGAVEITLDAVSENEKHLRERLKFLISTYQQPVLVEEFIVGREITSILLEGLNKKVYLAEKVFPKSQRKYIFATFEDQWLDSGQESFHYQKYKDPLLTEYVKKAFEITKMTDYGKFDVRLDSSGRYFFLDCNSNPAFGPKETEAAIANILDLHSISFLEILKRLLLNTMRDMEGKTLLPMPNVQS